MKRSVLQSPLSALSFVLLLSLMCCCKVNGKKHPSDRSCPRLLEMAPISESRPYHCQCPPVGSEHCDDDCTDDSNCPGRKLCCFVKCRRVCKSPRRRKHKSEMTKTKASSSQNG